METIIRPINYLGSKLRILDEIKKQIDELDPEKGPICDLFAGSGTVSNYMARERQVISIDVQEYSRVICTALLNKMEEVKEGKSVLNECLTMSEYNELKVVFGTLSEYEKECINKAVNGKENKALCDFMENTSLVSYDNGECESSYFELENVLRECSEKYRTSGMFGKEGIISYLYGGVYFSFEQTISIDAAICWINKNTTGKLRDKYLAAVISAASDLVNTVGKQFAQPISPRNSQGEIKKNIGKMVNKDRRLSFWDSFIYWIDYYKKCGYQNSETYRDNYSDAIKKLKKNVKVVYADPPYTRYHYSRYYHVLETIALGDFPEISTVKVNGIEKISKGIYRTGRHQSLFSIKSKAHEAFEIMFQELSKKELKLVLSYSPFEKESQSTPRMMPIDDICQIAKKYYSNIKIITLDGTVHNKFNVKEKNFKINCPAEILIVCC